MDRIVNIIVVFRICATENDSFAARTGESQKRTSKNHLLAVACGNYFLYHRGFSHVRVTGYQFYTHAENDVIF